MGTWSSWNDLQGAIISAPSAASRVPEKMAVAARGTKNEIVLRSWDETAGWGDWEGLGGNSTYDPALVAISSRAYALYAVGGKQITYRKDYTEGSGWSDWRKTIDNLEAWSGLAAASPNDNGTSYSRIDLFTLGATNNVLQATYPGSGSWGPYASIGATMQGRMGAASWGTGRLDLVARGAASNKLFHRVQNGSTWGNWREIGSGFISGPAISTWGPNRLDVFAKGHDHNLLHRFWNGQAWSEWLDLGVIGTDDAPAAVSRKRGNIELFVRGRGNKLHHRTYTASPEELDDDGGISDPS
jgi:hypothetical protein